jgi:hypothetical protein
MSIESKNGGWNWSVDVWHQYTERQNEYRDENDELEEKLTQENYLFYLHHVFNNNETYFYYCGTLFHDLFPYILLLLNDRDEFTNICHEVDYLDKILALGNKINVIYEIDGHSNLYRKNCVQENVLNMLELRLKYPNIHISDIICCFNNDNIVYYETPMRTCPDINLEINIRNNSFIYAPKELLNIKFEKIVFKTKLNYNTYKKYNADRFYVLDADFDSENLFINIGSGIIPYAITNENVSMKDEHSLKYSVFSMYENLKRLEITKCDIIYITNINTIKELEITTKEIHIENCKNLQLVTINEANIFPVINCPNLKFLSVPELTSDLHSFSKLKILVFNEYARASSPKWYLSNYTNLKLVAQSDECSFGTAYYKKDGFIIKENASGYELNYNNLKKFIM